MAFGGDLMAVEAEWQAEYDKVVGALSEEGITGLAPEILEAPHKYTSSPVPLVRELAKVRKRLLGLQADASEAMKQAAVQAKATAASAKKRAPAKPRAAKDGVLAGVTARIDVRVADGEDAHKAVQEMLLQLGAKTEGAKGGKATHLVFKDGSAETYAAATLEGLHIVSFGWVQTCKEQGSRVPESSFPVQAPLAREVPHGKYKKGLLRKRKLGGDIEERVARLANPADDRFASSQKHPETSRSLRGGAGGKQLPLSERNENAVAQTPQQLARREHLVQDPGRLAAPTRQVDGSDGGDDDFDFDATSPRVADYGKRCKRSQDVVLGSGPAPPKGGRPGRLRASRTAQAAAEPAPKHNEQQATAEEPRGLLREADLPRDPPSAKGRGGANGRRGRRVATVEARGSGKTVATAAEERAASKTRGSGVCVDGPQASTTAAAMAAKETKFKKRRAQGAVDISGKRGKGHKSAKATVKPPRAAAAKAADEAKGVAGRKSKAKTAKASTATVERVVALSGLANDDLKGTVVSALDALRGEPGQAVQVAQGVALACLRHIPVVSAAWVLTSLEQGRWCDHTPFLLLDLEGKPKPLAGECVMLEGPFPGDTTMREVQMLVHEAGATTTTSVRKASVVVSGSGAKPSAGGARAQAERLEKRPQVKSERWIFDSIFNAARLPGSSQPAPEAPTQDVAGPQVDGRAPRAAPAAVTDTKEAGTAEGESEEEEEEDVAAGIEGAEDEDDCLEARGEEGDAKDTQPCEPDTAEPDATQEERMEELEDGHSDDADDGESSEY